MTRGFKICGDNHRAWQPGRHAQRGHVRDHHHVAIAGIPRGELVALNGVVLNVDSQEVVAAFCTVVGDVLQEVPCGDALPDQATLHVGEGHDHGVDLTRVIELLKVALRNKACCRHGNAASQ